MTIPGLSGPNGSGGSGAADDKAIQLLKAQFEQEMKARSIFMKLDSNGDDKIDKDDEDYIGTATLSSLQNAAGSDTISFEKFKKLFTKEGFEDFVNSLISERKAEQAEAGQNKEVVYKNLEEAKKAAKAAAGPDIGGGNGTAKYVDAEGYPHLVTYWWEVDETGSGSSTVGRFSDMKLGK